VKPANQFKSFISLDSTNILGTGVTLGKAAFRFSLKPKLSEAFIPTSFCSPSLFKCSLLLIS